jgi:hypothetical protein
MPNSNYPTGFANGLTVRGMPVLTAYPGSVFWVSSGSGSNGNKGTFDRPWATIDYAVGRCTAGRGDIIAVKAGHTETVTAAGGLDLDVAGICVIGLGSGSLRPTVNFTTVVGADMDVDAANITVINMLFTGGIDALTGPIDVNAADFSMIGCETRDVTGQATDFIVTDANASRFYISDWKHLGAAAAGADTAISIVGGDDWVIENFDIYGNFAVAAIENVTTASNRARIGGGPGPNYIWTENAADACITMVAASTGYIGPNLFLMLQDNAANFAGATVGAAMQFMKPIQIVNLAGESSADTTITASTNA